MWTRLHAVVVMMAMLIAHAVPARAADVGVEWSGALQLGGGAPVSGVRRPGVFEMSLRLDALLGKEDDGRLSVDHFAGGFYVQLRGVDFKRGDFLAGVEGATPRWSSVMGRLSFGGGYRVGDSALPSGGIIQVQLFGGLRLPERKHLGAVLGVYLEGRALFADNTTTGEITAGVELSPVGLSLAFAEWLKKQ
jgi:hypothetical protein